MPPPDPDPLRGNLTATLPGRPPQPDQPTFDAPWQARSFAIALVLQRQGVFSWAEWTQKLTATIAAYEKTHRIETNHVYFELWQHSLEELLAEKSLL